MKNVLTVLLITAMSATVIYGQPNSSEKQRTWTYTYIKAIKNQRINLKRFIERNWFVMDSIAVDQGLLNDYQLLEKNATIDSAEWDFIVAVEYFTKGTYSDIEKDWLKIKQTTKKILIDGKDFRDLGIIVRSEEINKKIYRTPPNNCSAKQYEILKPYLGEWHEYLMSDGNEKLDGKLRVEIDPDGCNLSKHFQHITNSFAYKTLGYYNADTGNWIETYVFSNGGYAVYQWNVDNTTTILERKESSFKSNYLNRNKWINVAKDSFEIHEERSYDSGKTWKVNSITKLKRVGD